MGLFTTHHTRVKSAVFKAGVLCLQHGRKLFRVLKHFFLHNTTPLRKIMCQNQSVRPGKCPGLVHASGLGRSKLLTETDSTKKTASRVTALHSEMTTSTRKKTKPQRVQFRFRNVSPAGWSPSAAADQIVVPVLFFFFLFLVKWRNRRHPDTRQTCKGPYANPKTWDKRAGDPSTKGCASWKVVKVRILPVKWRISFVGLDSGQQCYVQQDDIYIL